MQKYRVEITETLSEMIDIEANSKKEAIEKTEKKYNNQDIILEPNSYKDTNFKIYKDNLFMNTEDVFEEYEHLTHTQRSKLDDFLIIYSIRNCDIEKKLTLEEEYKLFEIIDKTKRKDEEHIDISTIADNIVEAFGNGKVSMKALEKASGNEILDCIIGIGDFSFLDKKLEIEKEDKEI